MTPVATAAALAAAALAALRWLRVAQREHYLPGSCTRFAGRWWLGLGFNRLLAAGVAVNVALSAVSPFFALLAAVPIAVGPFGLRLRGTAPGPVRWTRRLRTLAAAWALLTVGAVAAGAAVGAAAPVAILAAALAPVVVDAALALTGPLERRLAGKFVEQATRKLRSVGPTVIGITGSFGKTSTKNYAAHLIAGARTVVASPASFNNTAGLARTVNEHLVPGTEVLVAEMGTYGPGEIAEMCGWMRPAVAAITAIGPVHLERMGSEEAIAAAKAEIFATADVCVLNVGNPWLVPMVDGLVAAGKRVVRCSDGSVDADVVAARHDAGLDVTAGGEVVARVGPTGAVPSNVAVAVALALEVGVPRDVVARRLGDLPEVGNRRSVTTGSTGATFIDDTYNSNPAGAAAALATLGQHAGGAKRVAVVTPGMVELGPRQAEENERFAADAAALATDLVVIGATNRRALLEGARRGKARVVLVDDRAGATAWVKENTGPDDVVLFENDLPDHFP